MPNFDAGHYFLTALAPIRLDSILVDGQSHSRRHLIREALASWPAGERTVASQGMCPDNPFARSTMTHFARFVVLDDVVFNGRVSGDSLLDRLRRINPLTPQKVDRLTTPYLIFVADFDAESDSETELKSYLTTLWDTMRAELENVFQHCVGFETVKSAYDFFAYIKSCQVETTMPFNDYWYPMPDFSDLKLAPYAIGAAVALLVAIIGLLGEVLWIICLGLLGIGLAAYLAVRKIMETGRVPFPTSPPPGPGSDLPTVLKALYLQRAFTELAIDMQGQDDRALYDAFGAFIAENKPTDTTEATQRPGVIGV